MMAKTFVPIPISPRQFIAVAVFLIFSIYAKAQRLVAEAPSHVALGQQFRLTFTVNTQKVSGFRVGGIPSAFEVLMGPSTSSQSSFQMVNGRTSSSSSITYTYILCANKSGRFTITPAQVNADGRNVKSNVLHISVSGKTQQPSGRHSRSGNGVGRTTMRQAGTAISGADLFIKVSANKRKVVEQEPVLLTYKVYTLVDLTQLEGKMPDLKGFHTQEVKLPQQKNFKIETLNGHPYRTVTWSQYVMFPQITGNLNIPSITFNGVVVQQNRNIDPFEAFFNGGSGYVEVKKKIKAPGLTIQVSPLPPKPSDFSLGVGVFNLSAQLDKDIVAAGDPVRLRVIVSGVGNLKLIKEPVVTVPKDFDRYDAKITDKTHLTSNGVDGSMIYDYLIVPRHQGTFQIPPVRFTYYDTKARCYQTAATKAFTLQVSKGRGENATGGSNQEDVVLLNQDIRHIHMNSVNLDTTGQSFFGSFAYFALIIALIAVFSIMFAILRQRLSIKTNESLMRGKRANRVAIRRLKQAGQLMQKGKSDEFYDEILKALWGYVGDKLNIPVEQLTRDNISSRLSNREVDHSTVQLFISALDECEFERYAPGDETGNMNKTYEAAVAAITGIEEMMKKTSHGSHLKLSRMVVACLVTLTGTLAPVYAARATNVDALKQQADKAYNDQHYQKAIPLYKAILKQGTNADVLYNLGNAYYRTDSITKSIIAYERALLLSPSNRDIRFNLQMAREKTVDKITPQSEMFFITWYKSLMSLSSVNGWAYIALFSLAVTLVLTLCWIFCPQIWLRKTGFFGGLLAIFVFCIANIFAYHQYRQLSIRSGAVVIAPAVTVRSTPSMSGTELFVLHEGTRVEITDDSMHGWKSVRVADGKEGWIEASQVERL